MCRKIKDYLEVIRDYKDIVITFAGAGAAIWIYCDFRDVVRDQAETAAKTAEILRVMQEDIRQLKYQINNK